MTVESLLTQYDFHDSSLVAVRYEKEILQLKINLCMWRQENYKENEPELKEINLFFKEVKKYTWTSKKAESELDYDEILKITYIDNAVKIVLYDEEISILSFVCNEVTITD